MQVSIRCSFPEWTNFSVFLFCSPGSGFLLRRVSFATQIRDDRIKPLLLGRRTRRESKELNCYFLFLYLLGIMSAVSAHIANNSDTQMWNSIDSPFHRPHVN
uniref:Transmembrane protein n=1 Tax=Utricularia reniformis TaxID=192314 RepID=A0A1Y0B1R9_9LAMI|nr:hypothetical protein AEK19_MT1182 [Utricularia reniformis]ART31395.1 hypothetical protein AEK19_MT1182 [Utricularia reniformis]